ncbi:hypothetical protein [Candidatus Poriferisodalis sp.]|uniref:hypothetical protein n=1 Tax=Candidatus Poriferisodalis sp. TaxID=3101277 RepID=UPI003B01235D
MAPPVHAETQARADERREPALIDLSEEWSLTFELLDDTQAWRERAVHEILLRDSGHVDATAAYQIRIPLELVRRYASRAQVGDRVRLLLPFAVRPKSLLLNVDLAGAEGNPASLVLKRDSALIQAGYMSHVDDRPLEDQPLGGALWAGVSDYTPGLGESTMSAPRGERGGFDGLVGAADGEKKLSRDISTRILSWGSTLDTSPSGCARRRTPG